MTPKPGEVWLADLGLAGKIRPVVIVSREDSDAPRALAVYVPVTTQNRGSRYEVILSGESILTSNSCANVQGMGALPHARLQQRLGLISDESLIRIRAAMVFLLEL